MVLNKCWWLYSQNNYKKLSDCSVGESVFLNVNGVSKEFIVVHQGRPSSIYDSSCDGVWLLIKDLYEQRTWSSSSCYYQDSTIHTYLNGTFLGLFDSDIQSTIKQVKIPYQNGSGGSVASGSSGLSTKIFLLSGYEVGWTTSNDSYFPVDGACLDYFSSMSATDSGRIGYYDGTPKSWWLRSKKTNSSAIVWVVSTNGGFSTGGMGTSAVRPALILPHDTVVDDNYNVVV